MDLTPRGSSPEVFWRDVQGARDQVGATYLYEGFDSATSWPGLLRRWLDARPDYLADTRFFMYAQAAETTPKTVDLFRQLGVFCVNTGFDAGDTHVLQLLKGPQDSLETNRRAAELWTESGVEMHVSFVLLGMGDEATTRRALDRTLEFAEWLARETTTTSLDADPLYPDKASTVGKWLWNPGLATTEAKELGWHHLDLELLRKVSARWRDQVYLDPFALCADFAQVCGVQLDILLEYRREIRKISARHHLNYVTW